MQIKIEINEGDVKQLLRNLTTTPMNKTTQYHIENLLVALTAFGQHLMGAAEPQPDGPPTVTGEPTTDKPKGSGRPRKTAEPTPAVTTAAPASSSAPSAEPAATPSGGFAPIPGTSWTPDAVRSWNLALEGGNGISFDQLKEATRPLHENGLGQELVALIKKHIPESGNKEGRLRELAMWPDAHEAFMKEVKALIPVNKDEY